MKGSIHVFTQEGNQCGLSLLAFLILLGFLKIKKRCLGELSNYNKLVNIVSLKGLLEHHHYGFFRDSSKTLGRTC